MTNTEQIAVLAIVAWVAYLVGTAKGQKLPTKNADGTTAPCADCADQSASAGTPNMDWFTNWSGLGQK